MGVIRTIVAVLFGLVAGSVINMGLVMAGPSLVSPPDGVDVTDVDSIARSMHLFAPRHFIVPFLAHALGTFVGVLVAWLIAASHKLVAALCVGLLFLAGGIAASTMIPAPGWFVICDLVGAYLPMIWLGIVAGRKLQK